MAAQLAGTIPRTRESGRRSAAMPAKRARSSSLPSERSHKRHAPDVIYIDDDEDDLQAILAQIKQQEESEALARRLQQEWAAEDANSTADAMEDVRMSSSSGPDDYPNVEDDETMARRLAAEWAAEDAPERVSIRKESSSHTQRDSSSSQNHKADRTNMTATEKLEFFREFFTGTRNCVECDHEVLSPRAFVSHAVSVGPNARLIERAINTGHIFRTCTSTQFDIAIACTLSKLRYEPLPWLFSSRSLSA